MTCQRCDGCRWVCENHLDRPWQGPCDCGGAGAPCPLCNVPDDEDAPRMPPGFSPDDKGWRH